MATRARGPWNHRHCAEHRKVEGYTAKVCVLPGQDGDEVEHFAVVTHNLAKAFRRRLFKPAIKRRQFDVHNVCGGHFPSPSVGKVCYGHKRMSMTALDYAKQEAVRFVEEIGHARSLNPRYARFYTGTVWG